jgi:hypothetical protein
MNHFSRLDIVLVELDPTKRGLLYIFHSTPANLLNGLSIFTQSSEYITRSSTKSQLNTAA